MSEPQQGVVGTQAEDETPGAGTGGFDKLRGVLGDVSSAIFGLVDGVPPPIGACWTLPKLDERLLFGVTSDTVGAYVGGEATIGHGSVVTRHGCTSATCREEIEAVPSTTTWSNGGGKAPRADDENAMSAMEEVSDALCCSRTNGAQKSMEGPIGCGAAASGGVVSTSPFAHGELPKLYLIVGHRLSMFLAVIGGNASVEATLRTPTSIISQNNKGERNKDGEREKKCKSGKKQQQKCNRWTWQSKAQRYDNGKCTDKTGWASATTLTTHSHEQKLSQKCKTCSAMTFKTDA